MKAPAEPDGPPPSVSSSESSAGFWVLSRDPRHAEMVMRIVDGTGTQVRVLEDIPGSVPASPTAPASPADPNAASGAARDAGSIRPDWFLIDLGSKRVTPQALDEFKSRHPECQLFLIAESADRPVPPELARMSVRHWFVPPLEAADLARIFRAALRSRRAELARQRTRSVEFPRFADLIGRSAPFLDACSLASRAAASASTVILIEGETGTGKGAFARAIHRASPRSSAPFVEVNCASLPGPLLESELFGHEAGAFTHAQTAKPGLLEMADAGTFFLDEVAETDPQVQAKILKFLDSGRYRRVGGTEEREVDVRVLTATQKDLERESRTGAFRLDLFHRLHVIRVRIPPVRERPGDARILLEHYLREFAVRLGKPGLSWSEEALRRLEQAPWPGNVREIVNLCERVVLLASGGRDATEIRASSLPDAIGPGRVIRGMRGEGGRLILEIPEGTRFEEIERAAIEHAIAKARGNVSAAAASLGMGRGQLRYRMERLGLAEEDGSAAMRPRRRPMRRRAAAGGGRG